MKLLVLVAVAAAAQALTQEQIVHSVNSAQSLWTAGVNFGGAEPMSLGYLAGTFRGDETPHTSAHYVRPQVDVIPDSFDSRVNWGKCPTIRQIRDQSACGSCWAFGAVEAMSDRICIFSNASTVVQLSADDLMSCGSGLKTLSFGCHGGQPASAWRFWVSHGVVTGGLYGSGVGCQPYPFAPCAHHVTSPDYPDCPAGVDYPTPNCVHECIEGYPLAYGDDKFYGKTHYTISMDEQLIQAEIMTNGPVEADFTVYEDFYTYQSGVYYHVNGSEVGGHAIRMLGWGVDNGTPYWLCANSWNNSWGMNGYFKILRGSNECGIEEDINAGIPATF